MGKKLFVGNLPYTLTEQGLRDLFSNVGTIESVKLITDRDSGQSKGFGFVEMSSDEEAEVATSTLNGAECDGRKISVAEARPMPDRSERSGGGFERRGGYDGGSRRGGGGFRGPGGGRGGEDRREDRRGGRNGGRRESRDRDSRGEDGNRY